MLSSLLFGESYTQTHGDIDENYVAFTMLSTHLIESSMRPLCTLDDSISIGCQAYSLHPKWLCLCTSFRGDRGPRRPFSSDRQGMLHANQLTD